VAGYLLRGLLAHADVPSYFRVSRHLFGSIVVVRIGAEFPNDEFQHLLSAAILSVLGMVTAAVPASKHSEWHASNLKARIVINPDSSLLVDETQVIPESPDPNFGN
jgi:hypothetical protein